MSKIVFALLLVILSQCLSPAQAQTPTPPIKEITHTSKIFKIHLNLPLALRYAELAKEFCPSLHTAIPEIMAQMSKIFKDQSVFKQVVNYFTWYYRFWMAPESKRTARFWIDTCVLPEGAYLIVMYTPEILAMADLGAHDLPPDLSSYINSKLNQFENMSLPTAEKPEIQIDTAADSGLTAETEDQTTESPLRANLEKLSNWCTSVIFKTDKSKYTLFSNLDLWFNYHYTNMAYQADYYRWGKLISSNLNIAGIPGSPRAYSHRGQFIVSLNKRDSAFPKGTGIDYFVLEMLATRTRDQEAILLENTSITAKSYDQALVAFQKTPTFSPVYYILTGRSDSGKNPEGVVIEKTCTGVHANYYLDWENPNHEENKWFLVQTNYDRDLPDPKSDYRRVPMEQKIGKAGFAGMTADVGWQFLHETPNFVPFGPQSYTFASFIVQLDYTKSDLEAEKQRVARGSRLLTKKSGRRVRIGRRKRPTPEVMMKFVYWAAA